MSKVLFPCENCGKRLSAPSAAVGRRSLCPNCKKMVMIPDPLCGVNHVPPTEDEPTECDNAAPRTGMPLWVVGLLIPCVLGAMGILGLVVFRPLGQGEEVKNNSLPLPRGLPDRPLPRQEDNPPVNKEEDKRPVKRDIIGRVIRCRLGEPIQIGSFEVVFLSLTPNYGFWSGGNDFHPRSVLLFTVTNKHPTKILLWKSRAGGASMKDEHGNHFKTFLVGWHEGNQVFDLDQKFHPNETSTRTIQMEVYPEGTSNEFVISLPGENVDVVIKDTLARQKQMREEKDAKDRAERRQQDVKRQAAWEEMQNKRLADQRKAKQKLDADNKKAEELWRERMKKLNPGK